MDSAALYARYGAVLAAEHLPCAVIDLDAFEANIDTLVAPASAANKTLRPATKSIRCLDLLRRIRKRGGGTVSGVMAFAVREAAWLASHGFDDIFVAYPSVQATDARTLAEVNGTGAVVALMVDDEEQLPLLEQAAREVGTPIPVLVEVDMSWRPLGGALHVGVRRSPLHRASDVLALVERIHGSDHLRFRGIMGYEAQIAGLQDANPFAPLMNGPKRLIKSLSRRPVLELRAAIAQGLSHRSIPCPVYNGGGTGSIHWSPGDPTLTEVTAGSGFLDSHLFDYFVGVALRPAAFFAVQAVRRPAPDIVTVHGGGWIASGEAGSDKLPVPWLPAGLQLLDLEGMGEVQTPLRVPAGTRIALGDPVLFRHAKAGELAEHVSHYLLVRGDTVIDRVPTYRGAGHCFLG